MFTTTSKHNIIWKYTIFDKSLLLTLSLSNRISRILLSFLDKGLFAWMEVSSAILNEAKNCGLRLPRLKWNLKRRKVVEYLCEIVNNCKYSETQTIITKTAQHMRLFRIWARHRSVARQGCLLSVKRNIIVTMNSNVQSACTINTWRMSN